MAAPIWKDYTVNLDEADASLATLDAIDFEVYHTADTSLIYTGRAYRRPGAAHVTLRINDICRPFVVSPFPELMAQGFEPLAASDAPEFEVVALDGNGDGYTADTVKFLPDWSYDYARDYTTSVLAAPINGKIDPRQMMTFTVRDTIQVTAVITFADGTTTSVTINTGTPGSFGDDFGDDFNVGDPCDGNVLLDISNYPGAISVDILGVHYDVVDPCHAYAIYYRNAFGGWDSLLLDGTVVPADGYARKTTERVIDNSVQTARAKVQYLNVVTPRWTLHTGWLKDDEVARLHHLTGTVEAYLCDLATGDLLPVNITDGEAVYHTLQTNGRRPVYFELNAELAQGRERR